MCGIAGLWAPETSVGPWFADATEIARHRGPDKDGWWVPGMAGPERLETLRQRPPETVDVALGFLALKILDLTPTGDQPMVRDDRATLTFNGEIYNYVEIREELRARGHTFRSTGDSEVLLRSYLEWGIDAIRRFDGMWAFGIYDHERQGLLLSRDRFGEKPLFWTPFGDGGVAFASEVKQLARFPAVELCLDAHRASAFVATGRPYDGSSSWFERIHQLEPGSWLWVDRDGIRTGRYFELRDEVAAVEPSSTPEAWSERFAEALTTSVMRRLRSDVPVGTSLSAGIDSSAIMAEATALGHTGYHSFTLGAEDSRLDERPEAQAFAGQMSSIWHGVNADGATFAAEWDRQTWHQEAPVASTSLFGQWKVMEAARAAGVVVMLDGQGSDEVLGGYHKFSAAHVLRTIQDRPWAAPLESVRFLRQLGGIATITRDGYRYLPGRTTSAPDVASLLRIAPPV
ncbi:MAG TPA: asparagine synthase (glutamine-hydrolyzing), partial [Candidatus Limnocylindrales bacterium]